MKTTIRDVKILQYYDGIVTATFNIEQKRYFMFLIAYDVNASQQRMYGAIEVEKGDLPKNLKEKVINSEIVYWIQSEPESTDSTQEILMIEMNENQKNEIIDPNLDFIERAVEDTSVDFWLNSQK